MKLALIRHGSYTPSAIDPEEGLSEEGRNKVETLKKTLAGNNLHPEMIYVSEKKRAQQTAEILQEDQTVHVTPLLNGGENPEKILKFLAGHDELLMLVGHNPFMETLATMLGHSVLFNTATCAIFEDFKLIDVF